MNEMDLNIGYDELKYRIHDEFLKYTICEECYHGFRPAFNDSTRC